MKRDYIIRFEQNGEIKRNFHDTLTKQEKEFEKMKKDSSIIWAELLHEPLEEDDVQHVIDSFEKNVVEVLGQRIVLNK